jgi:hypothetical protein
VRRLRRATWLVAAAVLVMGAAGVWIYRASRPARWVPGEPLPEITDRLARGPNRPASGAAGPAGETGETGETAPEITDPLARGQAGEAPAPAWTDVTRAAGLGGFRSFAGERTSQLPEDMGAGASWGDFDNDGDEDLFLVAAGGSLSLPPEARAPSRLYENLGDGTFRPVAGFPDIRILGMGAAWGDADGDGDLDLAVSGYRSLLLLRNEGKGRFSRDERFPAPDGYWAGLAWADFDRDGDLDLYVCGYVRYKPAAPPGDNAQRTSQQSGQPVPYTLNPASFEPESNLLLENHGDGTFEDVALLLGVSNPQGRSLSALWHDFDDDGWIDLYVANDISDNALFLNRHGETFEDAALAAWVADYRGAMGLAAGDWNRDGDDDLFITHWVAQENALYDSQLRTAPPTAKQGLLTAAGGPRPSLRFQDVATPVGLGAIALPLVGWGTEFADFDGDGWLDVVVANGSTLEDRRDRRRLEPQAPLLMWNRQGKDFYDLAPQSPPLARPRVARGLALSDYDGDGDLDLLLVHLDGGAQLLRNDMQKGHWLELRLRQKMARGVLGQGEGATAVAWMGDVPLRRSATGVSYLSQSTRMLHFGLGAADHIDRLEIRWPGGRVESFGPLAADGLWELAEGEPRPRRLRGSPAKTPEAAVLSRAKVTAFWAAERAGMDAMKRRGDLPGAIRSFREALAYDPSHEDSRYYLATCLWTQGARDEALRQLAELVRRSPMSHRGYRQWAVYQALAAPDAAGLAGAETAAERALAINGEDTGSLLLLGEIDLLQGDARGGESYLEHACRTNPRATGGFFLRAYLAWRRGDAAQARQLLTQARETRGKDWKPTGATVEGDVAARMHREETPLSRFWDRWDGRPDDPAGVFAPLAAHLERRSASPGKVGEGQSTETRILLP